MDRRHRQPSERNQRPAWSVLGHRGQLLREMLAASVQLRIAELRAAPSRDLRAWHRETYSTDDHPGLLPHVDVLLYGTKRDAEEMAAARRALVDGLAVAAIVADGGVDFLDLHFCTNHTHCLEARCQS